MFISFSSFSILFKSSLRNFNGDIILLVCTCVVLGVSNTFRLGAGLACQFRCWFRFWFSCFFRCLFLTCIFYLILKLLTIFSLALRINSMLFQKYIFSTGFNLYLIPWIYWLILHQHLLMSKCLRLYLLKTIRSEYLLEICCFFPVFDL